MRKRTKKETSAVILARLATLAMRVRDLTHWSRGIDQKVEDVMKRKKATVRTKKKARARKPVIAKSLYAVLTQLETQLDSLTTRVANLEFLNVTDMIENLPDQPAPPPDDPPAVPVAEMDAPQ